MGGAGPEDAVTRAVAAGGAALLSTGTGLVDPATAVGLRRRVRTTRLRPARPNPP